MNKNNNKNNNRKIICFDGMRFCKDNNSKIINIFLLKIKNDKKLINTKIITSIDLSTTTEVNEGLTGISSILFNAVHRKISPNLGKNKLANNPDKSAIKVLNNEGLKFKGTINNLHRAALNI